ncbi:MAG: asparagine synthase (glutamine-hydrolyzing) [Gammaproteobacteria bacterium]|nr:asparagine synthase (glutamine-hydrolyzing) [Gammaproteobacteria bacterium]
MCGIAGILDQTISQQEIYAKGQTMLKTLRHRGPDDEGLWISKNHNLLLAHRRLSIQDLSDCGHQPMHSTSQRYCTVFNGEIYNFKEIAEDLKMRGHTFKGHSDTEVLLAAIEKWGLKAAIQKFIGMFAFALWDKEDKVLHLCRDRLGEKPLYYGWQDKTFYFSSELKAIEVSVSSRMSINPDGLDSFLRHGYIPAPDSIYTGLHKLPPGCTLSLPIEALLYQADFSPIPDKNHVYSPEVYWSVRQSAQKGMADPATDETAAIDELEQTLQKTINRQLMTDVHVGAFLSGGIDSSLVCALAQHESSKKIKTYTIGFTEKEYDESLYAEKIAAHLGTDHLTMQVAPRDALDVVPSLVNIYDEPFADSSQIPTYLVSKLAREHVTVCLSGDGGDELFAGYNRYIFADEIWNRLSSIPGPVRKLAGRALSVPSTRTWDTLYHYISALKKQQPVNNLVGLKLQKLAGFMQQDDILQGYEYLLSFWHQPEKILSGGIKRPFQSTDKLAEGTEFINQTMYADQVAYLPGDNLTKVDRASMAVSLETRLPLLDHQIVELSWRMPLSMKIKDNQSKWALRQVLYRHVPKELIERPKMGFSVPIDQWLRGELKGWATSLLDTIDDAADGMLSKQPILKIWNEHISGRRDHSHRLWTVLMFLAWADKRSRPA